MVTNKTNKKDTNWVHYIDRHKEAMQPIKTMQNTKKANKVSENVALEQ